MIEQLKEILREDHRLKHGVDYALMHKYERTHVLCHPVWENIIQEVAQQLNLEILFYHIKDQN
jgi:hypothetical protein